MDRKDKVFNFIKDNFETPFSFADIELILGVKKEEKDELKKILSDLLSEKKIKLTKKKRYKYNNEADCYEGEYIGNDKGFGFITCSDFPDDFFVAPNNRKNALNKDIVKFKIISQKHGDRRSEAIVTEIIERSVITTVGTFEKSRNFGFVKTDDKKFDKDIFIPKNKCKNAKDNDKVVVKITSYGSRDKNPEGVITEVIGPFNENGNDVLSVIKKYDLPYAFPKEILKEADNISGEKISAAKRLDLRKEFIITIDGEDAKDLDDAVSLIKNKNGYKLGVHIADVSHYVKENSNIDKEAYKRGTSVYLADRVIPMLPKALSNGCCSLHPETDKYAITVFMNFDFSGNLLDYEFTKSIINTTRRMTYTGVTAILEGKEKCDKKLKEMLFNMKDLAMMLREKRRKRGSLDFDFPECQIIYDEFGKPKDIIKYELGISNYIIEEFMLIANETVAEYLYWQDKPMIYRIHEDPDPDKIEKFKILVKNLGYTLKGNVNEIHPKMFLELLNKVKGDKSERIIQKVMLRSLMKAEYSPQNKGHFGLASKYYCHFTSPIRRYPDLIVHRILKLTMDGKYNGDLVDHYYNYIEKAAPHTSECEIKAENAERETEDIKKAIYMFDKVGEEYEGVVSSVTGFGIFVELDNTVEGLVRYNDMKDYYIFDEKNYEAIGERYGKKYRIGDKVKIRVKSSVPMLAEIDFEMI